MITCVGNPVYDSITTLRIKSDGRVLSGCSTNACLALSKLGMDVTLVGRIGRDFAKQFKRKMQSYNINYFVETSDQSGGFELIYTDTKGSRTLDILGSAGKIDTFPQELTTSDWILFGPILMEIDLKYIKTIKDTTQANIFIDPQGLIRFHSNGNISHKKTEDIEEIASLSDVFKPNEMECRILTGIDPRKDYKTPAKIIKSWGPKIVIITLAEMGSVIYDGSDFFIIPPFATDVLDSTGAGDTYAGGFLYAMSKKYDYFKSGCFASSVSSIKIEHCGPDFPLTLTEAQRRMNQLLK
ncbi:carbohydrate kinase family protein [Acidobacteriota bacterium]